MSRLTKYLKQTAQLERHIVDSHGDAVMDDYGQPLYEKPVIVKCRKEPYQARNTTGYGQFVNYSTTYYFDNSTPVQHSDRIDGHDVQRVDEYRDGIGSLVGFEVQV